MQSLLEGKAFLRSMRVDSERRVRLEKANWGKVPFFVGIDGKDGVRFVGLIGDEGQICLVRDDSPKARRLTELAAGTAAPVDELTDREAAAMRALATVSWVKASFEQSGRMNITLPEALMSLANIFVKPAEIFVYAHGPNFEIWSQTSFAAHIVKRGMPELLDRLATEREGGE
jgi:hypothetical protein